MNDPRTVTAAETPRLVKCSECGRRPADARELWGLDAQGITTARLGDVDRWICSTCFTTPRPIGMSDVQDGDA